MYESSVVGPVGLVVGAESVVVVDEESVVVVVDFESVVVVVVEVVEVEVEVKVKAVAVVAAVVVELEAGGLQVPSHVHVSSMVPNCPVVVVYGVILRHEATVSSGW